MNTNNVQIAIPDPCHENWDAMTPAQQGRHCAACQKTVIDFTLMSDGQVLDVFKQAKGKKICGHFLTTQLERELLDNRRKTSVGAALLKRAAAILLLVQSFTTAAFAQKAKVKPQSEQQESKGTNYPGDQQIKGSVVSPVYAPRSSNAGVVVSIRGTSITATTDTLGRFTLTVPPSYSSSVFVIEASTTRYGYVIDPVTIWQRDIDTQELKLLIRHPLSALEIKARATTQTGGAEPQSPGIYQQKRGGQLTDTTSQNTNRLLGSINNVSAQGPGGIDMAQESKPTFWRRITRPFRSKKVLQHETK